MQKDRWLCVRRADGECSRVQVWGCTRVISPKKDGKHDCDPANADFAYNVTRKHRLYCLGALGILQLREADRANAREGEEERKYGSKCSSIRSYSSS